MLHQLLGDVLAVEEEDDDRSPLEPQTRDDGEQWWNLAVARRRSAEIESLIAQIRSVVAEEELGHDGCKRRLARKAACLPDRSSNSRDVSSPAY